ncbi:ABC transporter substrate-binding protein [Derxia gummosa]|uniref:ABC transporter substrate-binding protein n=1 Tax=Derxia gummosa DSM 723 TaxID=1121388 RepID=A0A9U5CJQ1_9BURK|nr:ABC transporter substrate-binding protein [Derxia gummosa]
MNPRATPPAGRPALQALAADRADASAGRSAPMGRARAALALAAVLAAAPAFADINIGVVASLTGPAASLGAETRKAVSLMPATLGGEKLNFILLDDATDPTAAVTDVRKLIGEHKVDAVLGPNLISNGNAIADVANQEKVPLVSVAPIDVSGDKRRYVFRAEPGADLMVRRIVEDMVAAGAKTVGFIGFSDSWGDTLFNALKGAVETPGLRIVAAERYGRTDPSVQAQVLKLIAAKPDVIFVGGSGTPAAMPQITLRERGYKGAIYQSHGVTSREFLRVGGAKVEGALVPVGPVLVAEQLSDGHATKKAGTAFVKELEAKYGADTRSTFAGASWDAWLLLQNAFTVALKTAKPGSPAFRDAVRDALENTRGLVGSNGVYTTSPADHAGYDPKAIVLVKVENGAWKLVK